MPSPIDDEGRPRIFYRVPDHSAPSWGVGLLYEHVRLLREEGFEAFVVHGKAGFRINWLQLDGEILYRDSGALPAGDEDILVVPEVLASDEAAQPFPGRRWVFVQGSFLIPEGLGAARSFRELGYETALAVLPHVADVLETHFTVRAEVVPPFVHPMFFVGPEASRHEMREKRIVIAVKEPYRSPFLPDLEIVKDLILGGIVGRGWTVEMLEGRSHEETAEVLSRSAVLVCLNTHEAFNTVVPEAMAAGCLVACYEAYGGRDFLRDGENARVFPNHHAWELGEAVIDLADRWDRDREGLDALRRAARLTAENFPREATRRALVSVFWGSS